MSSRALDALEPQRVQQLADDLGEALRAGVGQPRVEFRLTAPLLLEQRVEHYCADAGVGSASRRTPFTVFDTGDADATSGLRNARPM